MHSFCRGCFPRAFERTFCIVIVSLLNSFRSPLLCKALTLYAHLIPGQIIFCFEKAMVKQHCTFCVLFTFSIFTLKAQLILC